MELFQAETPRDPVSTRRVVLRTLSVVAPVAVVAAGAGAFAVLYRHQHRRANHLAAELTSLRGQLATARSQLAAAKQQASSSYSSGFSAGLNTSNTGF